MQLARSELKPAEYLRRSFAFRDYFEGARKLGLEQCTVFSAADESGYIVAVQSRRDDTPLARAVLEKVVLQSAQVPFGVALLTLVAFALGRKRSERRVAG